MIEGSPKDSMSPHAAHPNLTGNPSTAPRCGARTRAAGSCRQPAMPNGRCRLHGGKSTGPRSAEGRARCAAARITHGQRTADANDFRQLVRALKARQKALAELA